MTRVLLVTVGGSPEPILNAVESHQPDELIFICSGPPCRAPSLEQVIGEGSPCLHVAEDGSKEWRPNLVTQLGLKNFRPDLQILTLPDPDDLADIHQRIKAFSLGLKERFSRLELFGDYSGGTKTMSAALAMVLVDQGAGLSLVSGDRNNLIRIARSDGTRPVAVGALTVSRLLQGYLPELLKSHFYDRAAVALRELRSLHQASLDESTLEAITALEESLAVLMLWDRFRWEEALAHSTQTELPEKFPKLIDWWHRVVEARGLLHHQQSDVAATGYELVQDLLLNAERRGRRGWYDDAVARLYRALELLAQTYIQLEKGYDHQSFWEDEQIRRDCQQWHVRRGVGGLYWWLRQTEGGIGLGAAASSQWFQLRELLEARNQSLLGHGIRPVQASEWQELQDRVTNLVNRALKESGCQQGPLPHQLPGAALLELPAARLLLGES